jgi:A/G-specific adenine glycosylase
MPSVRKARIKAFRRIVWRYWRRAGRRNLPWRRTANPYRILVSEVMLQQTQVPRVIPKYEMFIGRFPDFRALAAAPSREVLAAWQGLGYNRRALALKTCAEIVTETFSGKLPADEKMLRALPGIGDATAGAIVAFAFNRPSVFIETNIRRAFIHFFFPHARAVTDNEIRALVAQTLPPRNIREWYWALMDYGAMLAERLPENPNTKSARYRRQSPFEGSHRQLRGKILTLILQKGAMRASEIARALDIPLQKTNRALRELSRDGFLQPTGAVFRIAERTRTSPIPKSEYQQQ